MTAAVYLSSAVDFSKSIPTRNRTAENIGYIPKTLGALVLVFAVIFDTVKIFGELQDGESGEFVMSGLGSVNWLAVGIVTFLSAVCATLLYLGARGVFRRKNK